MATETGLLPNGHPCCCRYPADVVRRRSARIMEGVVSRRLLLRIIPIWILVLIAGSLMPGDAKRAIGTTDQRGPNSAVQNVASGHRLYHFLSFGSTALLLLLVTCSRFEELAAATGTVLLGAALEVTQYYAFAGPFEWWDIRDDAIGVVLAYLLIQWSPVRPALVRPTSQ